MSSGSIIRGHHLASIATRRSMLVRLGDDRGPERELAWTYLFTRYAPAMERYVHRVLRQVRHAARPEDAADIVQGWFHEALAKGWLDREMSDVRCFRAWLQVQLRRLVYRHLDHELAQKRNPGRTEPAETLDRVAAEPADAALDQGLVLVAVEQALAAMRAVNSDYAEVVADLLRTEGAGSGDLGARLGKTDAQLIHLRHRARKRFVTLFHQCLRDTVRDDSDYEALLSELQPFLP